MRYHHLIAQGQLFLLDRLGVHSQTHLKHPELIHILKYIDIIVQIYAPEMQQYLKSGDVWRVPYLSPKSYSKLNVFYGGNTLQSWLISVPNTWVGIWTNLRVILSLSSMRSQYCPQSWVQSQWM